MFRFWDLNRQIYTLEPQPGCTIFVCTMGETCLLPSLCTNITCMGSCLPCSANSYRPCNAFLSGRKLPDITERVMEEMTDPLELANLQEELARLAEVAARRRDEVLAFIRGQADD